MKRLFIFLKGSNSSGLLSGERRVKYLPVRKLTPSYFHPSHRYHQLTFSRFLGAAMLLIGILIMLGMGLYDWLSVKPNPNLSSLMAIGFLLIMLGIAFFFPDMLKSGATDNTSSMRVAVYMVVCVFVLLCVKFGWNCHSFDELKLDSTWAYILGAALGSKAIQTFGEGKNPKALLPQELGQGSLNTGPGSSSTASIAGTFFAPIHDPSTINNRPPSNPPFK